MRRLIEKVNAGVLEKSQKINRDDLKNFIQKLDQEQTFYQITEDQLNTLKSFYDEGYIDFNEPWLKCQSLYESDRVDSIKNFAYTARILSIVLNKRELDRLYRSNKDNQEKVEELKEEIQTSLDPAKNNNYVFSTRRIREIVDDCDSRYKRLSKAQEVKDDWSNLTQDIEKLAARIYELYKNDRQRAIFDSVDNEEVRKIIDTLRQAAINAMSESEDRAPRNIQFEKGFKDKIDAAIDKAESQDDEFSIAGLNAKRIIDLFIQSVQKEPQETKKPKIVYPTGSGGYKDLQGNDVSLYDKNGNPVNVRISKIIRGS